MKLSKIVFSSIIFILSTGVNASVITTLYGEQYEWLEVTETTGLSRTEVEVLLSDSTSSLYGYEYATRTQVDDLFSLYATFEGTGLYTDSNLVSGNASLLNDFGVTAFDSDASGVPETDLQGNSFTWYGQNMLNAMYGGADGCLDDGDTNSCVAFVNTYT